MSVLIVVDAQRDFVEGALPAPNGLEALQAINKLLASVSFSAVVYSGDQHPPDHSSFNSHGGPWPVHCVRGAFGAELHPNLIQVPEAVVIDKGCQRLFDSASAFGSIHEGEGQTGEDTKLREILENRLALRSDEIEIVIVGYVLEVCVLATALSAVRLGFKSVTVLSDCVGVLGSSPLSAVHDKLREANVKIGTSKDYLN